MVRNISITVGMKALEEACQTCRESGESDMTSLACSVQEQAMREWFAATENAVAMTEYAPYISQAAVQAHAMEYATHVGPFTRLHTKSCLQGGYYAVFNLKEVAHAAAAVLRLKPKPIGGKVPTVGCWTKELHVHLTSKALISSLNLPWL